MSTAIRTSRKGGPVTPFPTGRLPSTDARNEQYPLRPLLAAARPAIPNKLTLDLRMRFDQQHYPACVGFTMLEHLYCKPRKIGLVKMGGLELYQAAQMYDEWPGEGYDGTSILGALKFLHKHQAAKDIKEYRWAKTVEEINQHVALEIHSGVLLGTNWYDSMFYPDKEGIIRVKPGAASGHAYYYLGYDLRRGLGLCQNHWGAGWGNNGRFWIPLEDLQKLLNEDGEAGVTIKYQKGE